MSNGVERKQLPVGVDSSQMFAVLFNFIPGSFVVASCRAFQRLGLQCVSASPDFSSEVKYEQQSRNY
jgi:hypothetical protein